MRKKLQIGFDRRTTLPIFALILLVAVCVSYVIAQQCSSQTLAGELSTRQPAADGKVHVTYGLVIQVFHKLKDKQLRMR